MTLSHRLCAALVVFGAASTLPVVVSACRTNESVGSQMSDSAITSKIKSKMVMDSKVAAHNIDVNTEEGVVYLLGRVETQDEKDRAERIARDCDGVRDVVNHLQVGPAPR